MQVSSINSNISFKSVRTSAATQAMKEAKKIGGRKIRETEALIRRGNKSDIYDINYDFDKQKYSVEFNRFQLEQYPIYTDSFKEAVDLVIDKQAKYNLAKEKHTEIICAVNSD